MFELGAPFMSNAFGNNYHLRTTSEAFFVFKKQLFSLRIIIVRNIHAILYTTRTQVPTYILHYTTFTSAKAMTWAAKTRPLSKGRDTEN